jgi:hypothetical protein
MAKEAMNAQEAQSPIKGQFPNKNTIICKDCMFRDKTKIKIGKNKIPVGVTKAFCEKYEAPPKSNGKPHDVLFENGICEYYEKEK